jgi:hypothetical protein
MKYFIAIVISLIGLFVFGTILKTEYSLALEITFTVLTFIIAFFWENSLLKKTFDSDFKIKSQRKTISLFDIGMATFWTIYLLILSDNSDTLSYLVFIFWAIPFSEFIMWFIYKKQKPFTVFIKGNELILNRRWIVKRNLTELTQIQYDRFSKNLKLDFKTKRQVSIKTTEYKTNDIQQLLEILIEISENNVFVPNNYEPKIKNSC